jgi:nicotinate-nucleotide adenylyltransferase
MGADNLRSFHRWQKWRGITKLVPFAVVDRLGPSLYASASPAGQALNHARIPEVDAASLPFRSPPAWVFIHGLKSPLSSTALRALRRLDGTPATTEHSSTAGKSKKPKPAGKKSAKKPKRPGKQKRAAKTKRKGTKKSAKSRRKGGKKRT